jgi:hypothetical protein
MAPRAVLLFTLLLSGCFPPGEGLEPPAGKVYFPVGLAVDEERKFLFVVNSDFDLQYNAGTVQSWDLVQLRARVPRYCSSNDDCTPTEDYPDDPRIECDLAPRDANEGVPSHWCVEPEGAPCGAFRQQRERSQALYPGRCAYVDPMNPQDGGPAILPRSLLRERSVIIGAFATDVVRRSLVLPPGWQSSPPLDDDPNTPPPQRLFIPVRGDATLHWIDIENGKLECGQGGSDEGACDDAHRSGDRSDEENTRSDGRLASEPFGLDADENGLIVMVTNQTSGSVALFSHLRKTTDTDGDGVPEESTIEWGGGPRYVFFESGMPDRPIGIANLPLPLAMPSSGRERLPGFLVSFRNRAVVNLLRVYDDAAADPARPYTRRYESEPIATNSSGIDSRGIGVDAFRRQTNERDCLERFGIDIACAQNPTAPDCAAALEPDFQECLTTAAATPLDVFIANRAPSSLIHGQSQPQVSDVPSNDLPRFGRNIPLDLGPARVYVSEITNAQGERERRIFTTCFDSRRIAVWDPERGRLETEIVTGRGPHAMTFDIGEDHAYAYVGHFLDSYVGVVDLDQRHGDQYGAMIATIAKPEPPRASK